MDGTWVYPPIGEALVVVGLDNIGVYIACCYNTVAQYIDNNPIMDLCLAAEQKQGLRLSRKLLENTALDILGIRVEHAAANVWGERRARMNHREREIRKGKNGGRDI